MASMVPASARRFAPVPAGRFAERSRCRVRPRWRAMAGERTASAVYTDGACSGNPGPGGWAWASSRDHFDSGGEPATTNNKMELMAVLRAIEANPGAAHGGHGLHLREGRPREVVGQLDPERLDDQGQGSR